MKRARSGDDWQPPQPLEWPRPRRRPVSYRRWPPGTVITWRDFAYDDRYFAGQELIPGPLQVGRLILHLGPRQALGPTVWRVALTREGLIWHVLLRRGRRERGSCWELKGELTSYEQAQYREGRKSPGQLLADVADRVLLLPASAPAPPPRPPRRDPPAQFGR